MSGFSLSQMARAKFTLAMAWRENQPLNEMKRRFFACCQTSVIFVADKLSTPWGNKRIKKNNETILKPLEMIEFL